MSRSVFDAASAGAKLLRGIEARLRLPQSVKAADAAEAVLCALTQRLSAEDALGLLEEMPATARGFLRSCVRHSNHEPEAFEPEELETRVAEHLDLQPRAAALVTRAVLGALQDLIPKEDLERVSAALPDDVGELWRAARASGA